MEPDLEAPKHPLDRQNETRHGGEYQGRAEQVDLLVFR